MIRFLVGVLVGLVVGVGLEVAFRPVSRLLVMVWSWLLAVQLRWVVRAAGRPRRPRRKAGR